MLRNSLARTCLMLAALAVPLALCRCGKANDPPVATPVPTGHGMTVRGFSIQLNDRDGAKTYKKAVDDIQALGGNWINFVVAARQADVHADSIQLVKDFLPSDTNIKSILTYAHHKGMHTMLMPIVLLNKAGAKEWRGVIKPKGGSRQGWDNWFASYNLYIDNGPALWAKECDVDIFCVGSELLSTEHDREHWLPTIANIRKMYPGKLTYSSNWDHYTVPTFWDKLDYIGMNNYNELAKSENATVPELVRAWEPIKQHILDFGQKMHKPVFFTEVGWHNLKNTISEPWNYVATGPVDPTEQLHAYQSFVEAFRNVPGEQFMGAFIWEWRPGAKPSDHGSYSLQGEPAMDVVKKWLSGS